MPLLKKCSFSMCDMNNFCKNMWLLFESWVLARMRDMLGEWCSLFSQWTDGICIFNNKFCPLPPLASSWGFMQSFSISVYSLFWDKIFLATELYSLFCKYRGKQNVRSVLQRTSLKAAAQITTEVVCPLVIPFHSFKPQEVIYILYKSTE